MATTRIIRPFLKYTANGADGVTPEEAVTMISKCKWATVSSRDDIIKTMLLLGWEPDDIAFSVNYALHGAPAGFQSFAIQ